MAQNYIEKIAQRYAVDLRPGQEVRAGDYLSMRPAHVMTHDNTAAVIPKFHAMGAQRVFDARQPVFALDHDIQNQSAANLAKYKEIESFADAHGIAFYPIGRGIGHQVMIEEGFVLPGSFVVASDSHANIYGALGALGTPVVRTDAAAIWATGRTWWQVPSIVRVHLNGQLRKGVSGKDVIISLIGTFNRDEVLNSCLEFTGSGVASLSMDARMTIANMSTEWGALAGVFPYDETTRTWLQQRAEVLQERDGETARMTLQSLAAMESDVPKADADAHYAKEIEFDMEVVTPFVAGPNEVKTIVPLPKIESEKMKVDKAFLLSCVNGRVEDFADAAEVLRGQHIAAHVQLFVAAASSVVEQESIEKGYWATLQEAGATVLPPGCGPCIGLGQGLLEPGEVGISATNRNFKGRMGSPEAAVYLASPAVVAASALRGWIAAPEGAAVSHDSVARLKMKSQIRSNPVRARSSHTVEIIDGFPEVIEGELLFVPKENMNTDAIYGKDWTYQEGMTPEDMASKAMLNYDPAFQELAQEGDILVGGYNFGTGSSREQAVTCLQYRGIRMLLAGSYSQTFKRNAFNNGYVVVECPELVNDLYAAHAGAAARTLRTGQHVRVDFGAALVQVDRRTYGIAPLGRVAQELVAQGGFEQVIAKQIAEMNRGN